LRKLPAGQLQTRLGLSLKSTERLRQALTHRSAGSENNERLEFLGDAVLGLLVAHALYERFPDATEGQLSRLRSSLVRKETLAEIARTLDLGSYMTLGPGELRTGGHARDSILADALEAVIGAVYLDLGIEEAQRLVLSLVRGRLEATTLNNNHKDPKTRLQELLQGRQLLLPSYELIGVTGADHDQHFTCRCLVPDLELRGDGAGGSRRKAEQAAALDVLRQLDDGS